MGNLSPYYRSEESKSEERYQKQFENDSEESYQEQYQDFKTYFFSHYQIIKLLGEGSFGKVLLVQHKQNEKDIYAMKMIGKSGDPLEEEAYESTYKVRSLGT